MQLWEAQTGLLLVVEICRQIQGMWMACCRMGIFLGRFKFPFEQGSWKRLRLAEMVRVRVGGAGACWGERRSLAGEGRAATGLTGCLGCGGCPCALHFHP